jgi:tetratricopeptide (TPR) repeat protein
MNDRTQARALYEESLSLRRALGDSMGISMSLNNLGHLMREEENYAEARVLFEEALSLVRELGNRHSIASVLLSLSEILLYQCDYAAALQHVEECIALFREMADRVFLEKALHLLSRIHRKLGDLARAQTELEERLTLAKELKDQHRLVQSLTCLGEILIERGDYPSAQANLRQGIQAVQEGTEDVDWNTLMILIEGVAAFATAQGQPERAARLLGAAAALSDLMGIQRQSRDEAELQARVTYLREVLGEAAFTSAWEAGRALDWKQALALLAETVRA